MKIRRKNSLRLQGYDYGSDGAYFLTICVQDRKCCLSEINDTTLNLTEAGYTVEQEWLRSAEIHEEIFLGNYVIMPNHMHMVVFQAKHELPLLNPIKVLPQTPGYISKSGPPHKNISALMRVFKSVVTKAVRAKGLTDFKWQRGFHDRVIRSKKELARINHYIAMNPTNWAQDPEYPKSSHGYLSQSPSLPPTHPADRSAAAGAAKREFYRIYACGITHNGNGKHNLIRIRNLDFY